MFYCGPPVRSCWAELKYDRILVVRGSGFELWLLKVQENKQNLQYFQPDKLTGMEITVRCRAVLNMHVSSDGNKTAWEMELDVVLMTYTVGS